ncbi:putative bifunctional diguanylate cyclase/phosphodiesterase [Pararhizobium haloflavum]|uniref:putative bifunctional diguanylate cyclase/phosphodiesterase n=1 Tax=Pararhizobium haloflavum TaxID=2037914 RepID=UPI000C179B63|nr:EAL domain-containing protein [Pararhizobium haloflavum]
MTHTDALTGLGNRRRMREKVENLADERAVDPAPFTIGIANLDGFKPINHLFGRDAGDNILSQVAHRLRACMPNGATVVRLDNDGFGFVLPLIFDARNAERLARMLKDVLSAPFDLGGRTVRLTACLGFAVYPFAGETFDALMDSADTALYRAKRRGRGQILVYSKEIADEFRRATELEQALRRAIMADEIDTHFQPIVRLADGAIVGFEALARWNDPDLGFVPPNVFITLAEERGFIDMLSEVLLKKAAAAAMQWPDALYLSFNLSSAQLVDPTTSVNILSIINRVGLNPRRLELEITETAMMSDPEMAQRIIDDLRVVGIRISLDDFGTGQSSLGRLRDFSFDKVKVDRAFVSEITRDRPSEHIVKAILAMCDGLDLHVIAEGIEGREQAAKLVELGCALGQGYHYGRPMTASAALRLLESLAPEDQQREQRA